MAVRKSTPTTTSAAKGTVTGDLVAVVNQLQALTAELRTDHNALLAKLDADAGVTDVNYATLHTTAAAAADTIAYRGGPKTPT